MKKSVYIFFILTGIFILLTAADITFRAMLPAVVEVPKHIETIAIIDRSVPDDNILNIIEGGLTGEGIGQDKLGTQTAIDGLNAMLQNSVKFAVIRTNEAMIGQDIISAAFPEPLPWTKIEEICKKYEADAIIALEKYDSDFIPTGGRTGAGGKGLAAHGIATVKAILVQGTRLDWNLAGQKSESCHYLCGY